MLKRKIYNKLVNWKENNSASFTKKALLVTGARQVGKSFIIEQFIRDSYEHFVMLDLIKQPDLLNALDTCKNSDDVFIALSAYAGDEFVPGNTCVFIDEVQEFPEIVTFAKYLSQQKGFDFIFSGSLLGVELKNITSQPVGYLDVLEMFPLDFEEFCKAVNIGNHAIEHVYECYEKKDSVNQAVFEKMLDTFHKYLIIGGMPSAVQTYVDTKNIASVKNVQKGIVKLYKADISKYAKNKTLLIKDIYEQIPAQLASQSKRFNFSTLASKGSFDRYVEEFLWIIDAGVVLCVTNVAEPRHPLKMAEKRSYFKLFSNDVGLLCSMCELDIYKSILSDNLGVNYGSIYENAIAQELYSHNINLRYFRNKKMGEVDFVIEKGDGNVLPIEVKSGKDYKRHSALTNIMTSKNYDIPESYVLCENNTHVEGNVGYLPVFMIMCIS